MTFESHEGLCRECADWLLANGQTERVTDVRLPSNYGLVPPSCARCSRLLKFSSFHIVKAEGGDQ